MTISMTICSAGDSSVGIPECVTTITMPFKKLDKPTKKWLCGVLFPIFSELHDVPEIYTDIFFSDECPLCRCEMNDGICNKCVLSQI